MQQPAKWTSHKTRLQAKLREFRSVQTGICIRCTTVTEENEGDEEGQGEGEEEKEEEEEKTKRSLESLSPIWCIAPLMPTVIKRRDI